MWLEDFVDIRKGLFYLNFQMCFLNCIKSTNNNQNDYENASQSWRGFRQTTSVTVRREERSVSVTALIVLCSMHSVKYFNYKVKKRLMTCITQTRLIGKMSWIVIMNIIFRTLVMSSISVLNRSIASVSFMACSSNFTTWGWVVQISLLQDVVVWCWTYLSDLPLTIGELFYFLQWNQVWWWCTWRW